MGSVVGKWRVRSLRADIEVTEYFCSLMFCNGCNADKIEATTHACHTAMSTKISA